MPRTSVDNSEVKASSDWVPGARRVTEWLALFTDPKSKVFDRLREVYGPNPHLIAEKAELFLRTLKEFMRVYDSRAHVIVVRAPGRVNLMGMHIDHQGGYVNPIAIREVILVAQKREDDVVVLHNVDENRFKPTKFVISDELGPAKILDWDAWTQKEFEKRKASGTAGDWSNYVKAAVLYLQHLNRDKDGGYIKRLKGMNTMINGNVPIAAGLSSSSSIVVVAAEATIRINELDISPRDLVDICGIAEWYVGTRGGRGDHAAIKLSKRGFVSHIGAFPLTIEWVPFPSGYSIVLCNSLKEAEKTVEARNIFNQRVAAYRFGFLLIKKKYPQFRERLQHLRDINPHNLGVDESVIYQMLRSLPERITRHELTQELASERENLERIFLTHDPPADGYKVRQICLYGIVECMRSEMAAGLLKEGDIKAFGELVTLSHEGDRVSRLVEGRRMPYCSTFTDAEIDQLIEDLRSGKPSRVRRARLYRQPGGYAVSCEELDELVDIAMATPGVVGAGLVGAGLGGCIVVIVQDEKVAGLIENLAKGYYQPRNLPLAVEVCSSVSGSGMIDVK